jgi:integrase
MARKKQGSICKKGNIYYAVLAIGSKRKWIKGGDTVKDAQRVLSENLIAVEDGIFRDIKKTTFREFGQIWIDGYVKSNIKETSHTEYSNVVGRLTKHFNDALLQNITGVHIQSFIAKRMKEIQPSTVQRETIILKQMLKYAYQMGYAKRNPGEFIKNPRKPKKEKSILDVNEAYRLLDKMDPHYRTATLMAILTGVRANELWGLTWDTIDFDNNMIHLKHSLWHGKLYEPKTATSNRRVDIPSSLTLELKKWKLQCPANDMNLVFPARYGHPVIHNRFTETHFKRALTKAELKHVTWHSLRHTNASIRIRSEQNPKYISQQLGHAGIEITYNLYGHLFNDAEFSRSQVAKFENNFSVR